MASKVLLLLVLILFARATETEAQTDCATVTALIFTCSVYITYGTPNPAQGTPCCDAMTTLYLLSGEPPLNRRIVCCCLMVLINTHISPALPGWLHCQVSVDCLSGSRSVPTSIATWYEKQHNDEMNSKTSVSLKAFRIIALFCLVRSAVNAFCRSKS